MAVAYIEYGASAGARSTNCDITGKTAESPVALA